MLRNGDFSNRWESLPPVAGFLRIQRPNDWQTDSINLNVPDGVVVKVRED